MASLATLRTNTLVYLGTTSGDRAFPSATLDLLINNAVNALLDDIGEANPAWLRAIVVLPGGVTHEYALPVDFSGWLKVKLDDADGAPLTEVRDDELDSTGGYVFSIIGTDHGATLTTGDTIAVGQQLYMKYKQWPSDLTDPTATPEMVPKKYHDLIALYAAEEGMGLGGEGALPASLVRRKEDRHAQLMMHVSRRGTEVGQSRGVAPQGDD